LVLAPFYRNNSLLNSAYQHLVGWDKDDTEYSACQARGIFKFYAKNLLKVLLIE